MKFGEICVIGNYDFNSDVIIANETEKQFGKILEKNGWTNITYNNDYKYDIKAISPKGKEITFEIKEDFLCKKYGNVAIEFGSRGKQSGIEKTEAKFYVYKLHEPSGNINFYYTFTDIIKKAIEEEKYFRISENGGDKGSNTKNYLFDINEFKTLEIIKVK